MAVTASPQASNTAIKSNVLVGITAIKTDALIEITLKSVDEYWSARSLWGCKYLGYDEKYVYLYYFDRMPPGRRTVIYRVARSVLDDAAFLRIEEEVKLMIEMSNRVHFPVTIELGEWLEEHPGLKLLVPENAAPKASPGKPAQDKAKRSPGATSLPQAQGKEKAAGRNDAVPEHSGAKP